MLIVTIRGFKIRLYPTKQQAAAIMSNIGCCRFVHNYMVTLVKQANRVPSYGEMSAMLPGMKSIHPWMREADSTSLQRTVRDLSQSYRNHFRNPKHFGWPVFRSRKRSRLSYTTPFNSSNAHLLENGVKLPKIGVVKAKASISLSESWKQLSITVSVTRTGKFFASVCCERSVETPETPVDRKTAVGLDYKSDGLFVTSNGVTAGSLRSLRKMERRLKRAQRRLSRKVGMHKSEKPSKNFRRQQKKVAVLYEKATNQRRDFLHKLSTAIAKQYDTVCIEDLDMKAMSNRGFRNGKSVMDNAWGIFTNMLQYKLEERGGRLVKISRWYPSSQTCSKCGRIHPEMKDLSRRTMTCGCGNVMDRDVNAAVNILNEGLRMLGV